MVVQMLSCNYWSDNDAGQKKWDELIKYIHKEIEQKNLNEFGVEFIVIELNKFYNRHGFNEKNYSEIRCVLTDISKRIETMLSSSSLLFSSLDILTQCIINPNNQKALFDFSKPFSSEISPEYFFEKELFGRIICKNTGQIEFSNIKYWIKKSAFYSFRYCKRIKLHKAKKIGCCAYFLVFLVLSLMLNCDSEKGYVEFEKMLAEFSDFPDIQQLFNYILTLVVQNFTDVKNTYFTKSNTNKHFSEITLQTINAQISNVPVDVIEEKFKTGLCETIKKIIVSNCSQALIEEIYLIDNTIAERIVS